MGEAVQTEGRLRVFFARRVEHGAECDVIRALGEGALEVGFAVHRDPDLPATSAGQEFPCKVTGKILLTEVHAVAPREAREIRAVVCKQRYASLTTHRNERPQQREHCATASLTGLVTELKGGRAGAQDRFGERQWGEPRALQCRDVDDGIQPAHELSLSIMKGGVALLTAIALIASVADGHEPAPLGSPLVSVAAAKPGALVPAAVRPPAAAVRRPAVEARGPSRPLEPPSGLPPVAVSLRVVAPSAKGQWLLRIDNEGSTNALVSADVRFLRLEIRKWDAKKGAYAKAGEVCDGPSAFGLEERAPFGRELVLEPGQSYVEPFDPRLICFGKQAGLLEPGVMVMPSYGFTPRPQLAWKKTKAPELPPFVADTAEAPRTASPLKQLVAESLVLGDATGSVFPPYDEVLPALRVAPKSAEAASRAVPMLRSPAYQTGKDGLAAAMALTTDPFADARGWRDVGFEVQAHNVGQRPLWAALRARQLSFMVYGSAGEAVFCPRVSQDHAIPRDLYEALAFGQHRHIPVTLVEPCNRETFQRPGIYAVVPTLHADDPVADMDIPVLKGTVTTRDPGPVGGTHQMGDDATLVRVRFGAAPFYSTPPKAIPTLEAPKMLEGLAKPSAS